MDEAADEPTMPDGWTITHEARVVATEDRDSAFVDGMQWTVRDPRGQRPPQSQWPTPWRAQAVLYARSLAARELAGLAGEVSPPWSQGPVGGRLVAVPRPDPVAPQDWTGLPHERPGLFRRTT